MDNKTIILNKNNYVKTQYERVIDTSFTQLNLTPIEPQLPKNITVPEFFEYYKQIFFLIPKFGDTDSHNYLIKTSQEYIGDNGNDNDDITQALIQEITSLREENLQLQQQIINTING